MAKFCDTQTWGQFKRGKIAAKIHEFHGGMGTATYKVGSLIMAGECVPQSLLLDAADEVSDERGGKVLANMLKGWARAAKPDEVLGSARRKRKATLGNVAGMGPCCVKRDRKGKCKLWAEKRFVFDGHISGKCIPPKRRR